VGLIKTEKLFDVFVLVENESASEILQKGGDNRDHRLVLVDCLDLVGIGTEHAAAQSVGAQPV